MHTSRRARQMTVLLGPLVAAALLAGCSSSSNGTAAGGVSTGSTPPVGTSTGAPAGTTPVGSATPGGPSDSATGTSGAPDKSALTALMIAQADLPAGWTAVKSDDSTDTAKDKAQQAAFARCVGIRNTDPDKVADVSSDDFTKQNTTVSSNASSYTSAADVTTDAGAFADKAKLSRCMTKMIQAQTASQLPAGSKIGKFTLKVEAGSGGGPSNVIATISTNVKITASGTTLPVYIVSVYIAGKQIEANLVFEKIGSPVDPTLQAALTKTFADRVAGA